MVKQAFLKGFFKKKDKPHPAKVDMPDDGVVYFGAEWAAPSRAATEKLKRLGGVHTFLDVDHNPDPPAKHNIRGVPTLAAFKGGKMVDSIVGNQTEENFKAFLEKHN